jgi:hypothetical protein
MAKEKSDKKSNEVPQQVSGDVEMQDGTAEKVFLSLLTVSISN